MIALVTETGGWWQAIWRRRGCGENYLAMTYTVYTALESICITSRSSTQRRPHTDTHTDPPAMHLKELAC
jgi:hypothetical protein